MKRRTLVQGIRTKNFVTIESVKKHWRLLLKIFVGLFVIPAAIAGTLYRLDQRGFFALDHIEIVLVDAPASTLHLKPLVAKLDEALEIYRGRSLWSLKLESISGKVGGLNWVEAHSLARGWPGTLTIKVKPSEIKALYVTRNQKLIPVIREGKMLDAIDASVAPDVALLDGAVFQARPEVRRRVVEMLDEIPKDGAFSRRTISEVRWSDKDGFRMRMTKSGVDVRMGDERIGLKSIRVSQVLEYLNNRGMVARSVDANLSKKVLVRLQSSSGETVVE